MALKLKFYKCDICGNIVQVLIDGAGELVCCGQKMNLMESKKEDIGSEKHVPVFENLDDGSQIIRVGAEPHPMTEEHYIQFIETISPDKKKLFVEFFQPSEPAEMHTYINSDTAFEHCNIHGLWEGNND